MEEVEIGKHMLGENLEEKRSRRAVYQDKRKAERKRFGNVMRRYDQKRDVFEIAKKNGQNFSG